MSEFGIDYSGLPADLREEMKLYIERGVMPGDFCEAVIKNQLVESFGKADESNRAAMFQIACWVYNRMPLPARGEENYLAWLQVGGLEGLRRQQAERAQEEASQTQEQHVEPDSPAEDWV